MYTEAQLNDMLVPELREIAESLSINNFKKMGKSELVSAIIGTTKKAVSTHKTSDDKKNDRKRLLRPRKKKEIAGDDTDDKVVTPEIAFVEEEDEDVKIEVPETRDESFNNQSNNQQNNEQPIVEQQTNEQPVVNNREEAPQQQHQYPKKTREIGRAHV